MVFLLQQPNWTKTVAKEYILFKNMLREEVKMMLCLPGESMNIRVETSLIR